MDVASRILVLTVAGACGVNVRYWLGLLVTRWLGNHFPWATVVINVSGSFAIGFGAVLLADRWPHPLVRIGALTGFLGGYTTFSSAMFETFTLWERGDRSLAVGNLIGSMAAGMVAVALGVLCGHYAVERGQPTPAHAMQVERRLEAIADQESGGSPAA